MMIIHGHCHGNGKNLYRVYSITLDIRYTAVSIDQGRYDPIPTALRFKCTLTSFHSDSVS